jgi:hypothetical protein
LQVAQETSHVLHSLRVVFWYVPTGQLKMHVDPERYSCPPTADIPHVRQLTADVTQVRQSKLQGKQ